MLSFAMVAGMGKFAFAFVMPWIVGEAINVIAKDGHFKGITLDQQKHELNRFIWYGVATCIIWAILSYLRGQGTAIVGNRVIRDLRQDLFDHLHRLSLHFYSKQKTGSIVSRLTTDISTASQIINGGLITVAMDSLALFIGFGLLFNINWKLAVAIGVMLPFYWISFRKFNPRVRLASLRVQSQISKISGNAQERLAGIALIKTYAAEGPERDRFREDTEEHLDRVLIQSRYSQFLGACSEFLSEGGRVILFGVGGYLAFQGELAVGDINKALGYLLVMLTPVRRFAEVNIVFQMSLASIDRVFDVFEITPIIANKDGARREPPATGLVEFKEVRFRYPAAHLEALSERGDEKEMAESGEDPFARRRNGELKTAFPIRPTEAPKRWVLDGISFTVQPGERVAFVGPSGAGKTTLVSLLPRLYDVQEGGILIDGSDVRDYMQRRLRQSIGIVQQDSFLFSGTIEQNIAYGRQDASRAQVIAAAEAANAHKFITELAEGYGSIVGERGVNLSGGQRQRLSIARAILKDPKILILDEATSALDTESEHLVQQALERLMQNRTSLIIAHRLSTVRTADRIFVMQSGKIVEIGKHDELIDRGGLYARLVKQQFTETEMT